MIWTYNLGWALYFQKMYFVQDKRKILESHSLVPTRNSPFSFWTHSSHFLTTSLKESLLNIISNLYIAYSNGQFLDIIIFDFPLVCIAQLIPSYFGTFSLNEFHNIILSVFLLSL